QDIWNQLREDVASNLRRSVVSLVLNDACRIPCTFSGIAIECQNNVTKFVTTGILVSALKTGQFEEDVIIKVHYEGNVATGYLDEYDSDCQLAAVKVMSPLDIYCIHLNPGMESMPCKQLIVVGCVFDTLIATSGKISHRSKDRKFLILSRISEKVSCFVSFIPFWSFFGHLLQFLIFIPNNNKILWYLYLKMTANGPAVLLVSVTVCIFCRVAIFLSSCVSIEAYVLFKICGIILVNTYEDPFCDLYPKGVWGEFRKRVSFYISQNVVALSSFKETRFFACTRVFINYDDEYPKILTSASLIRDRDDRNKIVEDLRNRPVKLQDSMVNDSTAVAVGWIFQSGALMVASGKLIVGSSMLDCEVLCYSTCKISKVGIGGSLVDVDGNFISMKFHEICYNCEKIGTLYVYSEDLCRILEFFKTKNTFDCKLLNKQVASA
uniref:Uncharacterized protein n=1 Tax=Setaria italica TaxID=4555 RepID=K4A0Z0_SETIT